MLDPSVVSFVLGSLPPAPCRVLEVGAGDGELAEALRVAEYDVLAIDPGSETPAVRSVPLHELAQPPGSYDAAVAVVSLHHVEPLAESCQRLGELVRPAGTLVLDEFDVETLDEPAAQWWLDHASAHAHAGRTPAELIADLRHHCHGLSRLQSELARWFELGPPHRGPYLYRWDLPLALREQEERSIAAGVLPATGARIVGIRRPEVAQ